MPGWAAATLTYCGYVLVCAALLPRLRPDARFRAVTTALIAATAALCAPYVDSFAVRSLLLPVASLILGYRSTGFLWRAPDSRAESILINADRSLRIRMLSARAPRVAAELLECAYAAVYPLIPLTLWLHMKLARSPDPDWLWTVILVTDYACFAMLPWVQTRPPRALEPEPPWRASFRRLNLRILHNVSIHMNTVPSGHAAEALACALILIDAPSAVVASMFVMALSISAGAVLGRYHYAIDIVLGWVTAVVVWFLLRS
jgi:hypothetical protein